jgi:hypothetical protein
MTSLRWIVVPLFLASAGAADAQAGEDERRHEWTFDATVLSATLGYAWGSGRGDFTGVEVGAGPEVASLAVVSGDFASSNVDDRVIDIVHAAVFERFARHSTHVDLGLRGSVFVHPHSDDFSAGAFLGGYVAPFVGGRTVKVGPRVALGFFNEVGSDFGISITPLTVRLVF